MIFFTGWIYHGRSWAELPLPFLTSLSYAVLYIYTFCMGNQLDGVEEDRLNKPYRPLVTGLVTVRETYRRFWIYNILYALYGLLLGTFWYAIAWIIVSCYLNLGGGSNHWATKNLVGMTLGTFILFNVQWSIALPADAHIGTNLEVYFALMSAWAGFALPIQDLRDMAGDLKGGRRTLPIVVGDTRARWYLCIHYLIFLPATFLCAMLTQDSLHDIFSVAVDLIIFLIQLVVHWTVAVRLLLFRSPSADHKTYHCYVLLFVASIPMACLL
ncbi:UbiA family prenyltransferase [Chitinophaga pinensis]|nr:UbiA family prenyltransferase [Chitinophaga pinensis]